MINKFLEIILINGEFCNIYNIRVFYSSFTKIKYKEDLINTQFDN